ncbi:hypothetical protein BIW11_12639 [Tropilaelaps mercedesae]|uniref:Uncharacterized protein n=1 Tax=Tropilaelaps mercedesae TaxID=418985 RepID=A0A1V9X633_9ACAR|nr:hypothetical protein BIW11_12639 [Tropilaelaps mercedesae]
MGDEGDFGESFRSEDPESQGESETTEGAEGSTEDVDYQSDVEPSRLDKVSGDAPRKSGGSTWLIVAIVLVLLVIAGVVAYFVIQKQHDETTVTAETEASREPEPDDVTQVPEAVTCAVASVRHPDEWTYGVSTDIGKMLIEQNKTARAHAVLELDSTLRLPLSVANEANNSFIAIVLPFVEGNMTFFFLFDNCTTTPERVLSVDQSYAETNDFRSHFGELVGQAKRINSHKCWADNINPTLVPSKEVPVAAYTVKTITDLTAQVLTVEGCEDAESKNCKRLFHEKVPILPSMTASAVPVTFHVGWNDRANVGTKFSLHDYVKVTPKCYIHRA